MSVSCISHAVYIIWSFSIWPLWWRVEIMNVLITLIEIFIFSLYFFLIRPIGINVESWNRPLDSNTVTKRYSYIHNNRPTIPESYHRYSKQSRRDTLKKFWTNSVFPQVCNILSLLVCTSKPSAQFACKLTVDHVPMNRAVYRMIFLPARVICVTCVSHLSELGLRR
jgi:hypothetical protein